MRLDLHCTAQAGCAMVSSLARLDFQSHQSTLQQTQDDDTLALWILIFRWKRKRLNTGLSRGPVSHVRQWNFYRVSKKIFNFCICRHNSKNTIAYGWCLQIIKKYIFSVWADTGLAWNHWKNHPIRGHYGVPASSSIQQAYSNGGNNWDQIQIRQSPRLTIKCLRYSSVHTYTDWHINQWLAL